MEFLNRSAERTSLARLLSGRRAALGRVYGRRRLGKTELLRTAWTREGGLFFTLPETSLAGLLKYLSEEASRQTGRPLSYASFRDFVRDLPNHGARLVVLDEFQRLMREDPAAESELQEVWDARLQNSGIVLVLCGSVVGMMRRLDDRKAPLHGRITWDLKLQPFSYSGVRLFYPKLKEDERVERFGVFGSTPHYHRATHLLPLAEAIDRMFLDVAAPLREEHKLVLEMELDRPERYHEILLGLGQGKRTLGEIAGLYNKQSASDYTSYLATLRDDLGIVRSDDPLYGKKRSSRIFFDDPFFQFYFSFIFPQLGRLELGDAGGVREEMARRFQTYLGTPVFEEVARHTLRAVNGRTHGGVRFEMDELGAWWDGEEELDAVGVGRDAAYALEAKFRDQPCSSEQADRLLRRAERFREACGRKRVVPILLSKSGFSPAVRARVEAGEIVGWTLKDVSTIHDAVEPTRRRRAAP